MQSGVLGESENGSYLYFVANGVLGDGAEHGAVPGNCKPGSSGEGMCNLYVRHEGETILVAVLSGEDYPDWAEGAATLENLTARVSPDGRYLAFMSSRELTGYDNVDAQGYEHEAIPGTNPVQYRVVLNKEGQPVRAPDEEVYEYDAVSRTLSCASCEPTGARPVGGEYAQINNHPVGGHLIWNSTQWLAATVPGWTPFENGAARYQSRYLSNTGRLFFNARSALVPNDVNNQWDVYQYEPASTPSGGEGVGTCTSSTGSGSDVFKPAHAFETEAEGIKQAGEEGAGCVGLISNGESKDESAFLDASATGGKTAEGEGGGDVFFLTTSQLAPQDVDDSYDIYDAHECTAESRCAQPATSPPPCENEASCKPAPEPQPSIYGPPASATFSGPGNLTPETCSSDSSSTSGSAGPGSSSSSSTGSGSSSSCGSKPPPGPTCSSSLGAPSTKCSKKQNLSKALATCKRKYQHSKKKRGACETTARHRYAAKKAGKSSAKKSKK